MDELLRFLLSESAAPTPLASVHDAWQQHLELKPHFPLSVDLAAAAGFKSDQIGFAFLSGYQAALSALLPDHPSDRLRALCATEQGGGHPAAIRTELAFAADGASTLTGTKSFVTLGTAAEQLVVVASTGSNATGQNQLRVVLVDAKSAGVTLHELPALPFIPEVPHAEMTLTDVRVASGEILAGDGYTKYLKPFRTIEDIHVFAAVFGWLLQVARRSGWPTATQEKLLAVIVALRGLALEDPSSPAVHVALGGVFSLATGLTEEIDALWPSADDATRQRWQRDRSLLTIAGRVRSKRLETAWRNYLL